MFFNYHANLLHFSLDGIIKHGLFYLMMLNQAKCSQTTSSYLQPLWQFSGPENIVLHETTTRDGISSPILHFVCLFSFLLVFLQIYSFWSEKSFFWTKEFSCMERNPLRMNYNSKILSIEQLLLKAIFPFIQKLFFEFCFIWFIRIYSKVYCSLLF